MDKYQCLITVSIISLIFDNIPKILQLNTISSGLANKFAWYPLFLLFLLKVIEFYKEKTKLEIQEKNQLKFIGLLVCIFLICNIQGLLIYPYYDELLAGPLSQIEKLPLLLQFLQQHDIIVSVQNIFMSWIGVRAIKGTMVNFHSKCKILGGVAEFFSKAFLCRFPPENFPRPVVYPVHSLPV